ncbi:MAG: LamG-like jellyroll fold domain-containing protein [Planctomycetota bacterium]
MFEKLIYLISLVLLLGLAADRANADITTDLVGYWKLDDNANDSSGNNYHGEEFGNPFYVPGMIDQAMDFDGPEQSVYIPEFTAVQNQDEVTICMWVKADRNIGEDQVMWFTDEDGSYGRVRFGINGDEWEFKHGDGGSNPNADDGGNPIILGEWTHLAGVRKNNDRLELFVNAISAERIAFGVAGVAEPQASIGAERRSPTSIRNPFDGVIDEVRFYTRALTVADIQELFAFTGAMPTLASYPDPPDKKTDVPREVVLSWKPGEFAPQINGHKVYLSENFNDVNDGIGGITQSADNYTPEQRLDFDKTYYWRVDELNTPPDNTVFEGVIWSFTTEPVAYPIENITATASSSDADKGPENTVNGSGLDDSGLLHSDDGDTMWLSNIAGPQPTWIQYEFDKVYKLHEMWVWNSNTDLESSIGFGAKDVTIESIGFGAKDVTIEYSIDGIDYMPLGTTHEFARATAADDYTHNTTVDLGSIQARYVRLTINSSWGGWLPQYGLSEVRFFQIPVSARNPYPDSGATGVDVDVTLGFRAGREAAEHNVYFSDDEQAVIDGTAPVTTVSQTNFSPSSLNLGKTYYWRVDEVNNANPDSLWQGDIWSFTAMDFLIIDDMESYNDLDEADPESNRIYIAWEDGITNPANGGSIVVGYDNAPFAEQTIVHSGRQSMPFTYDNSVGKSEATLTLTSNRDWTVNGVNTLTIWYIGDAANAAETMYVVLNGSAGVNNDNPNATQAEDWTEWTIDLQAFGINLTNVNTVTLGLGKRNNPVAGGSGMMYFDDIRLYAP